MEAKLAEGSTLADQAGQRDEFIQALRASLFKLPELERQLVALYYGGGFSQVEIAAEMSIPRRTVSSKIGDALRRLRVRLSQAGFAAAAPMLSASTLQEALFSGEEVPTGLFEKIMTRIAQLEHSGHAYSPRRTESAQADADLASLASLVLLGVAGLAFCWIACGMWSR